MEDRKHGIDYRRQWRKVRLDTDAATLDIRAMELTDNSIGVAPMLPSRHRRATIKSESFLESAGLVSGFLERVDFSILQNQTLAAR